MPEPKGYMDGPWGIALLGEDGHKITNWVSVKSYTLDISKRFLTITTADDEYFRLHYGETQAVLIGPHVVQGHL